MTEKNKNFEENKIFNEDVILVKNEDIDLLETEELGKVKKEDYTFLKTDKYNNQERDYQKEKEEEKEEISLEYTLNEDEIFSTVQNTYRLQFGRKRVIQSILLGILVITFAVLAVLQKQNNYYYIICLSIVLLLSIWILPYFYNKSSTKKNLRTVSPVKAVLNKDRISFSQDSTEVVLLFDERNPKTQRNRLEVIEYPHIYLFFHDEKSLYCLPKRTLVLEEATDKEVRAILKSGLKKNFHRGR